MSEEFKKTNWETAARPFFKTTVKSPQSTLRQPKTRLFKVTPITLTKEKKRNFRV